MFGTCELRLLGLQGIAPHVMEGIVQLDFVKISESRMANIQRLSFNAGSMGPEG